MAPAGSGGANGVIVVDRDAWLTHLQYRTRTFEPRVARDRLAALSEDELERLIKEHVREEALHSAGQQTPRSRAVEASQAVNEAIGENQ